MNLIAQTLADGLVLGGIYALAAVGFSLIFGVLHVINLSHGILVLLGAYLALILSKALSIDPLLTLPMVMAVLFAVGYVYQRFLIQHAVDRSPLGSMLLTFGVALMLQNIMIWVFSPDMKSIKAEAVRDALAVADYETFYSRIKFTPDGDGDAIIMGSMIGQVMKGKLEIVFPGEAHSATAIYPAPPWDKKA